MNVRLFRRPFSREKTRSCRSVSPPDFYVKHGIDLRLGTRIASYRPTSQTAADRIRRRVCLRKARTRHRSSGPHTRCCRHFAENVLYLRSLMDSKRIRERAANAKKAVVVGGGFIAMEVASVLAARGVETTMLIRDDRMWKTFFTPEMSAFFRKYYLDHGTRAHADRNRSDRE